MQFLNYSIHYKILIKLYKYKMIELLNNLKNYLLHFILNILCSFISILFYKK